MATPKAKKKKAATKSARTAAKKTKVALTRKAAKRAKAAPPQRAAKGKAAPARKGTPKRALARAVSAARKGPAKKKAGTARGLRVVKPAAKPGVARALPIQRRDHAGHIDPKYAAELLGMSEPHEPDPRAFIERARSSDDLVEELGEEFVQEVTSAEYKAEDALNEEVAEEVGGPFVETQGATEFAPGTDASNPESATREPFPST